MSTIKKLLILGIVLLGFGAWYISSQRNTTNTPSNPTVKNNQNTPTTQSEDPLTTIIVEDLDTPWAIVFLPDNQMLVTERVGQVWVIDRSGRQKPALAAEIPSVEEIGEGGLLGIALHPNFSTNNFVYLYYTYEGTGNNTLNRVVRMTNNGGKLSDETIIVDRIPGAPNHNGGRIKFGPDGMLYIGTGDAQDPSQAQNTQTLGGKILRVTDEGKAAPGNPFGNPVYSYGHRNVQGLAWDGDGTLWATEHGSSAQDEVNLIESGKNYGWPVIQGNETRASMITPVRNSGPDTTWAPSGAAFAGSSLFFAGLRGQTLYEAVIQNNEVAEIKEHFAGEYGRLREVVLGPDGMLYITTSNLDGRGNPNEGDDKIIRINPAKL